MVITCSILLFTYFHGEASGNRGEATNFHGEATND